MARQTSRPSPLSVIVLLVLAGIALSVLERRSRTGDQGEPLPPECGGLTAEECQALLASRGTDPDGRSEVVLDAAQVCVNVGYLCADVVRSGSLRILRWPETTSLIRVWVPEPSGLPPGPARELQRAAQRGIEKWDGHPFPLAIRIRPESDPPDVTVQWVGSLGEGRLGRAQMGWTKEGTVIRVRIPGFFLVTHDPFDPSRILSPEEVELVAAHEMGHALGLPHSDDPRDVMYPQNAAYRLTTRDYRTLEALYSFTNGAEIRR